MRTNLTLKDIIIKPESCHSKIVLRDAITMTFDFSIEGITINKSVIEVLLMTDEFESILKQQVFTLLQENKKKISKLVEPTPDYYHIMDVLRIFVKSNHQFTLVFNSHLGNYQFDEIHTKIEKTNISSVHE